ncbi:glycosyltransferase family 2 protein [Compostibacter hankyongensis]|uniref:Glycosyltransferase family 2 protein n=1 Tax=Compostibacter hankyongensis TaxID=1007089 RepID=A0ABP8G6J2_9BACT
MDFPLISVITVCFNAEKHIARTIESVRQQDYPRIEYIVVDGGSTDDTVTVIRSYGSVISRLLSEKDRGLYDAMNKGLRLATGDYVFFLNADDTFYDAGVLRGMIAACPDADAYYGEVLFVDEQDRELGLRSEQTPQRVPERLSWKSLRTGMVVSHQGFLIRRSLAAAYDLRYKVCADVDWMIRCLKQCRSACNTHLTVTRFRTGGTSKQRQRLAWKERYRILQKHYGVLPNFFTHLFIVARYIFSKKY